jgi:AcrR family transcriptional regulator
VRYTKKAMKRSKAASAPRPYHHGNLPESLLRATAELIEREGPAALSLREVARQAGVSHAAPAHHFGDKAGLLTALAAQGFELFTAALRQARDAAGADPMERFAATGRAYVLFAARHRAHFEVMFRPDLVHREDAALAAASGAAYAVLTGAIVDAQASGYAAGMDPEVLATTAWSTAHGLATLWLAGNLRGLARHPSLESLAAAVFGGAQEVVRGDAANRA